MKMKRTLFLIVAAFAAIVSSYAQLITWSVKPGVYSRIEPCWGDMYFVYNGNSIGVIKGDGNVVVAPDASRITGFHSGYALVLKSDGGRERILGVLSEEGTYTPVSGEFFTIPNQEFFSEGFATVTNQQGKAGYMNTKGQVEKQFDVTFVTPFTEGYATIGEGREFKIIDKRFNALRIIIPSNSPIYGGTGVYKGQAIVWDGEGTPFCLYVNNGTCNPSSDRSIKRAIKNNQIEWDYLGCFSSITRRPETISYDKARRSSETLGATEQGGKFGYVRDGKIILPCQFEQAEAFYGNYAIVKSDGKQAILALRNADETFAANPTNAEIKYKEKEAADKQHNFRITVPSLWKVGNVVAKIKDENGAYIPLSGNEGSYEFKSDAVEDGRKFHVELESDGLKLWSGDIAYKYEKEKVVEIVEPRPDSAYKPFSVSLKAKNTQADKNNRCYVEATISNPNSEAITATVYIKGSNLLEAVSQRVTIPAFGTKDISTYFTVTKAISGQTVTVSTTAGGTATLDGLQLIPF